MRPNFPMICFLAAASAWPQNMAQHAEFEVASIRPNKTAERMNYGLREDGVSGKNIPLKGWIQIAWGVRDFQIAGPEWLTAERFDIEARAAGAASAQQKLLMLQALIEARFKLALHRETRQSPVYFLVVG